MEKAHRARLQPPLQQQEPKHLSLFRSCVAWTANLTTSAATPGQKRWLRDKIDSRRWLPRLVGPPMAHELDHLNRSTSLSNLKSDSHFMKPNQCITAANPSPIAAPTAPNVEWRAPKRKTQINRALITTVSRKAHRRAPERRSIAAWRCKSSTAWSTNLASDRSR